ncbi:hypothetical protein LDENG_00000810 [Lucifuga dentata]|nr:hypothetical protein LDENG_00000810 [Lucifuga dentata]
MGPITIFVICTSVVVFAQAEVTLEADMPSLSVPVSERAILKCCYNIIDGEDLSFIWIKRIHAKNITMRRQKVNAAVAVTSGPKVSPTGGQCGILTFSLVQLKDSGMYYCVLNGSSIKLFTHGTYLQVYKRLEKTINLTEHTKNNILIVEGILLLLCAFLPSTSLLCKSRKLNEVEKKKMKKEEENIYQGLNLDDCGNTYDQIGHTHMQDVYEDVENMMEEEIELEKP